MSNATSANLSAGTVWWYRAVARDIPLDVILAFKLGTCTSHFSDPQTGIPHPIRSSFKPLFSTFHSPISPASTRPVNHSNFLCTPGIGFDLHTLRSNQIKLHDKQSSGPYMRSSRYMYGQYSTVQYIYVSSAMMHITNEYLSIRKYPHIHCKVLLDRPKYQWPPRPLAQLVKV